MPLTDTLQKPHDTFPDFRLPTSQLSLYEPHFDCAPSTPSDCPSVQMWMNGKYSRAGSASTLPSSIAADPQKPSAVAVRALQKRARKIAESEFVLRNGSISPATSSAARKKQMRNKSAFVSRQTQRNYEQLLAAYVVKLERERDVAIRSLIDDANDIIFLRRKADELTRRLNDIDAVTRRQSDMDLLDQALAYSPWTTSSMR